MKILITGDKGFIGETLKNRLVKNPKLVVVGYDKDNTFDELNKLLLEVDYVYHLAGEVRPNVEDKVYKKNNTLLSEMIVAFLTRHNKKTPVAMVSTIHAENPKNEYGKSKRDAENIFLKYSEETGANVKIYRLSHVFGKGCKPNYNSVITTWIYNSIHDLEINVYDREIEMNYIYVDDLVDDFINELDNLDDVRLKNASTIYKTTLGEVVDIIEKIKLGNYLESNLNEFEKKLLETYYFYKKVDKE